MAGPGDRHDSPDDGDEAVDAPERSVVVVGPGAAFPPFGFPGLGSSARRCSFCSRSEGCVATSVQARGVYICHRCIDFAAAAVANAESSVRVVRIRPKTRLTIDRDEAEDAIESAYEIVFGGLGTDRDRCAAIESGDDLLVTMAEVQQRFAARDQVDVAINAIRFLDDNEAEVGFSLMLPGQNPPGMAMPMPQRDAVRQDKTRHGRSRGRPTPQRSAASASKSRHSARSCRSCTRSSDISEPERLRRSQRSPTICRSAHGR